jgi:hypothetical protein
MTTTFAKHRLSMRQFCCNITIVCGHTPADGSPQKALIWFAVVLPLACNVPPSAVIQQVWGVVNTVQQCFCKGNGGVREHSVLLENLFLVRIGSRDSGHISFQSST